MQLSQELVVADPSLDTARILHCQDYEQTEVYYALSIQLNKGNWIQQVIYIAIVKDSNGQPVKVKLCAY